MSSAALFYGILLDGELPWENDPEWEGDLDPEVWIEENALKGVQPICFGSSKNYAIAVEDSVIISDDDDAEKVKIRPRAPSKWKAYIRIFCEKAELNAVQPEWWLVGYED